MFRRILLWFVFFFTSLLLLAPATCWDALLRRATQGGFALLAAEGSLWTGEGQLALLDPSTGRYRPIMPMSWHWSTGALIRGAIAWDFSFAASPPFSLDASFKGLSVRTVRLDLPARFVMERIPNTIGGLGWNGNMQLTSPVWQCSWRGLCNGNASLDWTGAGADIFPGRHLGDYKFDAAATDGVIDLSWNTTSGEVRVAAKGKWSPTQPFSISGTISGNPEFTSRLPNIAGRLVQPTGTPGSFSFAFNAGSQ